MLRSGVPEDHAVLPDLGGVLPRRREALPDGAHEGEAKRANGLAPPHATNRARLSGSRIRFRFEMVPVREC